eukprot:403348332
MKSVTQTNFYPSQQEEDSSRFKITLMWDLLKTKLRKSEEDEMARLVGREIIQKAEDLRDQYQTMAEILNEMEENDIQQQQISFQFEKKNADFVNKEISFFIDNLRKKALDSGLNEDSLMPINDQRDKQIYDYIRNQSRPQSAISQSTRPGSSQAKGTEASMRGSFYSTTTNKFNENQETQVIEGFKLSHNILEFNEEEKKILAQIKSIMQEECDRLQEDIDEIQNQLMFNSKQKTQKVPNQKELKDFSNKLQEELLRSDQILKVANASSTARKNSIPRFGGTSGIGQTNPITSQNPMNLSQISFNKKVPLNLNTIAGGTNLLSNQSNQDTQQKLSNIIPKKGPIKLTMNSIKKIDNPSNSNIQNAVFKQSNGFSSTSTSFNMLDQSIQQDNQGETSNTTMTSEFQNQQAPTNIKKFSLSKIKNTTSSKISLNKDQPNQSQIPNSTSQNRAVSSSLKERLNTSQSALSNKQRDNSQSSKLSNILSQVSNINKQNEPSSTKQVIQMSKIKKLKTQTQIQAPKKQELYGFDIDFLEEMGLGGVVQEVQQTHKEQQSKLDQISQNYNQKQANKQKQDSSEQIDTSTNSQQCNMQNKNMQELQEEFDLKKSAPKKLRGICKDYRSTYADLLNNNSSGSNELLSDGEEEEDPMSSILKGRKQQ